MAEEQVDPKTENTPVEEVKVYTRKQLQRYLAVADEQLNDSEKSSAFEKIHQFALGDLKDFVSGKLEIAPNALDVMDNFIETFAGGYSDPAISAVYSQAKEKLKEVQEKMPDMMKAKSDHLFDLLSKKELSDAEKKEVQDQIKELPELLQSKSFMARFEVPNLLSGYQAGENMSELLEKNAAARETLGVVLENLKEVNLPNGQSAAKYMLDNSWLPNGELIGTQFVKNIHFLGAASRDTKDSKLQDGELKTAIRQELDATATEYKELYSKDGYNANPNRSNYMGQKVGDVQQACTDTPNNNVEDLRKQIFAQTPHERQELLVDRARDAMTLDQLREGRYRGTLTAEQAELLDKKEKEADLSNFDGDQPRYTPEDRKGEKFKDEDIIKYMYEEWFLAGMSWLFDKAEDGMEILLNRVLYGGYDYNAPVPIQGASENAKSFIEKVNAFNGNSEQTVKQIQGRSQKVGALTQELSEFFQAPAPEKETKLKAQYGETFVNKLKEAHKKNPEAFRHFMKSGAKNMAMMSEITSVIAQRLAQLEMTSEAMKDMSSWFKPKTDKFLDDAGLEAERNKRAAAIQNDLIGCCLIIAEEERSWAGVRYDGLSTAEQKDQFVQDEVLNTADPAKKEKLKQEYEALKTKGTPEQLKSWVCENIAAQRVLGFLDSQSKGVNEAQHLIRGDLDQGRYEANGKEPCNDGENRLKELKAQRRQIQNDGAHDAKIEGGERLQALIEHKNSLLEAVKENNLPIYFEQARAVNEREVELLRQRREQTKTRQKAVNAVKEKIYGKNKYTQHQTQQGMPLRRQTQHGI